MVHNVSKEPSAVTHPRLSGRSEPLMPDTVISQRPSYTPYLIVQRIPIDMAFKASTYMSYRVSAQPHEPALSTETTETVLDQLPTGAPLWLFESQSLQYVERLGAPHSLMWVLSPCQPFQPDSKWETRIFSSVKSPDHRHT